MADDRPEKMDWHDRFILGRSQAWNVPPVNTLFKGDYSEASKTPTRPPSTAGGIMERPSA